MFDFTFQAILRDCLAIFLSLFIVHALALIVARFLYSVKKIQDKSFKEYVLNFYSRLVPRYTLLALALFFAVYTAKLVLIRMLLALCYTFILLKAFLKSDSRTEKTKAE